MVNVLYQGSAGVGLQLSWNINGIPLSIALGGDRAYRCGWARPAYLHTCDVRGDDLQWVLYVEPRHSIARDERPLRVSLDKWVRISPSANPTIASTRSRRLH